MSKKKPKLRHEVWIVEWFDAHDAPSEWGPLDSVRVDRRLVQSVGFLLESVSDVDHLVLVTSDDGNNHVANGIIIPRVNVVSRRKLS